MDKQGLVIKIQKLNKRRILQFRTLFFTLIRTLFSMKILKLRKKRVVCNTFTVKFNCDKQFFLLQQHLIICKKKNNEKY